MPVALEGRAAQLAQELAKTCEERKVAAQRVAVLLLACGITVNKHEPSRYEGVEEGNEKALQSAIDYERIQVSRLKQKAIFFEAMVEKIKAKEESQNKQVAGQGTKPAALEEAGTAMDEEDPGCEGTRVVPPPQSAKLNASKEQRHAVMVDTIRANLKPDGELGENASRLFHNLVERARSPDAIDPLLQDSILRCTGLHLRNELKITSAPKPVKLAALGPTKFVGDELVAAILRAPFLCIAANESLRHRGHKYPVFVSFWDVAAGAPWRGAFRICIMRDETAQVQAQQFYVTLVDALKYPRERVLYVLSDITADAPGSGKEGGVPHAGPEKAQW